MADDFIADKEKYDTNSFENGSYNEITEIYDSVSDNGSLQYNLDIEHKNNSYTYDRNVKLEGIYGTNDYVPYDSTSEEDDVFVSQTIAEINPEPTMKKIVSIPNTSPVKIYKANAVTFVAEEENEMLQSPEKSRKKASNIFDDSTKAKENDDVESDIIFTTKLLETVMADESLLQSEIKNTKEQITKQDGNEHSEVIETNRAKDFDLDTDDEFREPYIIHSNSRHSSTSCNNDEYTLHMKNFNNSDLFHKLRIKNNIRKSWSFSNERMRDIERQNQILLKKILTQKPTYSLKQQKSISNMQHKNNECTYCTRITSAAVNRKKKQRQIDLDNQVLKRKIEAISLRRPIL